MENSEKETNTPEVLPEKENPDVTVEVEISGSEVTIEESQAENLSEAENNSDTGQKEQKIIADKTKNRKNKDTKTQEKQEDIPEQEKMPKEKAMEVLEAILFANGDEVYFDQFAKIIGYSVKEATKIVDEYAKLYDTEAFPRGIKLIRYEKCCQLATKPELAEQVTAMIGIRGEPQLSPAAMETLAIIAYNQPVTRAYIEQVRRVDSTRPITVLLDRELIEEKGRLEVIGRPRLFGTTQNFLRTFGITSLDQLPSLDLFNVD